MSFTKIKDVDLKILSELPDRDLLNVCITDKYAHKICQDEHFWRNRLVLKYGDKVFTYKPKDVSWKNYYMQIIIDLEGHNPLDFLNSVVWYPMQPNQSLYQSGGKILFLVDAPTSFLNKLRYLNFDDIVLRLRDEKFTFKNISPENLLKIIGDADKRENIYIRGLREDVNGEVYIPNIQREWEDLDVTDEE